MQFRELSTYVPSVYDNIKEITELVGCEQAIFTQLEADILQARRNQFIATCDEETLAIQERIYQITNNPSVDTIEYRRQRLIAKKSTTPPYTDIYLASKLDEIIGVGKWNMYIIGYDLYIESSASNMSSHIDVLVLLNQIKPANLKYISIPLDVKTINTNETVSFSGITYNYKLGSSWVLGALPFQSLVEKGVVKLPETPSISPDYLTSINTAALNSIKIARLNGTKEIAAVVDLVKMEVTYDVTDAAIKEITLVELLDASKKVLTSSAVYIPVIGSIKVKHIIRVKEGV